MVPNYSIQRCNNYEFKFRKYATCSLLVVFRLWFDKSK